MKKKLNNLPETSTDERSDETSDDNDDDDHKKLNKELSKKLFGPFNEHDKTKEIKK